MTEKLQADGAGERSGDATGAGRGGGGESGGGASPDQSGGDGAAGGGPLEHGGQSEIGYHGPGQLGDEQVEGKSSPNAATRKG